MAFKFPTTDNASTPPTATPTKPSTDVSTAPREQRYTPPASDGYGDDSGPADDGFAREEGDKTEARTSRYPKPETFAPLEAGEYDFIVSLNKVTPWHFGTRVALRVEAGLHRGRVYEWEQVTPEKMTGEQARSIWRSTIYGAYAFGGWPLDPDPKTGWPGWPKGKAPGSNRPPYDLICVHEAPDGVHVPVLLDVHISVRANYEKFPALTHVRQHEDAVTGGPVQAPMPFGVPEWMARAHKWSGKREDFAIKSGENAGRVIECFRLQYDQIKPGHCGMPSWRGLKG